MEPNFFVNQNQNRAEHPTGIGLDAALLLKFCMTHTVVLVCVCVSVRACLRAYMRVFAYTLYIQQLQ